MSFITDALGITNPNANNVQSLNTGFNSGAYNDAMSSNPALLQQRQQLLSQLGAQAQGQGPSVAGNFLQGAMDKNTASAMAMANSARGAANPGLAMKTAMQNSGEQNMQAANQAAQMKAQEQLNAQGQMGGLLNSGIGMNNQMMGQQLNSAANVYGTAQNAANQTADRGANGLKNFAKGLPLIGSLFGAHGGVVPGHASVPGDSYANDKVMVHLAPGEIVVPRSKAHDPEAAKAFIDHLLKDKKGDEPQGYGKVLEAHRKLHERVSRLEKKVGRAG